MGGGGLGLQDYAQNEGLETLNTRNLVGTHSVLHQFLYDHGEPYFVVGSFEKEQL